MVVAYAELHAVSNFTFLRGASHPEELVARAAQLNYSALAITDECSLAGVVRVGDQAAQVGVPAPILREQDDRRGRLVVVHGHLRAHDERHAPRLRPRSR